MSLSHFEEKSGVVSCNTGWGRWYQTAQEVTVEVNLKEPVKAKEVKICTQPKNVSCNIRGTELFKGEPCETVIEDESTWTLEDGGKLLRILYAKANPGKDSCWVSLLKNGSFAPDPHNLLEMRKKLDLELFQIENPGFDFSGAKLDKKYEDGYLKQMEKLSKNA